MINWILSGAIIIWIAAVIVYYIKKRINAKKSGCTHCCCGCSGCSVSSISDGSNAKRPPQGAKASEEDER